MKASTPSQAIGGDEEQNGKQKKEQIEKNGQRDPNPVTIDQLVTSYDPNGSYGEPITKPSLPTHRGINDNSF